MRYRDEEAGAYGELTTLPGCSQVVVSHGVFVEPALRGMGRGKLANKNRLDMCCDLGYDYILCTVESKNTAQLKVLEANKWVYLDKFKSRRTGHTVLLYGKELND